MAETNPTGFEDGLRRFLEDLRAEGDRRSGGERRRAERRMTNMPVKRERRSGLERRRGERRVHIDRRRPQVEQFTFTQSRMIREMVQDTARDAACPLCEGTLLLGPVETHAGVRMQDVVCTSCRRSTLLVDG